MKKNIKFSLIISIIAISIFFNFVSIQNRNIRAAEYTLTQTFTDNVETYFEEISVTSNPSVLHLRFEYLSVNEPGFVMQVYNITAGNNTQMWSDSERYYVLRLDSNIELNITVTSSDDNPSNYPAPFRLKIYVNQILSITDQDDYIWTQNLYFSGDSNYLILTYNEITAVNIHTILNESGLDHLWVKARIFGAIDWSYSEDSLEDESFLSFQVMPGETWELYVETMGNPVLYPLELTLTISTSDKTLVSTKTAEYSSYLTEEASSHFYEIPITETYTTMRVYCLPNYTIYCKLFNSTDVIFQTYVQNYSSHTGWEYTFDKIGNYLLKLNWETPIDSTKNNYTLRLVLGEIEINLSPNVLYNLNDYLFHPGDLPKYKINIPSGDYHFKIIELGERKEWKVNFTEGYTDTWINYYYTVIMPVPPFPIQVFNWKEQIYSKLVEDSCSLVFTIEKHLDDFDYNIGFIIEEYILPDQFDEELIYGELLNQDDFSLFKVNISESTYLEINHNTTLQDAMTTVTVEIYDEDMNLVEILELNETALIDFVPVEAGIYFLKVKENGEIGKYYIKVKMLEITKKGTGFGWLSAIIGIISLEISCFIITRRRK